MEAAMDDNSFFEAIKSDDAEAVRAACAEGLTTVRGRSPLIHANWFGSMRVLEVLLEAGHDPKQGHLLHNVSKSKMVKRLLELGLDPNELDAHGRTPLTECEDAACVKALIKGGANPNNVRASTTPLVQACGAGQSKVVEALLEGGADPNMRSPGGLLPLKQALNADGGDARQEKIVQLLLKAGADPHQDDVLQMVRQGYTCPSIEKALSLSTGR
jgi:ankyrin repeat protein